VVGWDKGSFRGRSALEAERATGPRRRLTGLATEGRQPPREGAEVLTGGRPAGTVTSGNFSPMLGHGIALALLDTGVVGDTGEASALAIEQRGRTLPATVVKTPFVRAGQFADTDRPPTT